MFSCQSLLQLPRFCAAPVDAKMKVADRGYGVATFGILAKDRLRTTTLARSPGSGAQPQRTQGRAYTSHTIPHRRASTKKRMQILKGCFGKLMTCGKPAPALRDLPWQITSCNSTRISNLALSRPGSLAFHRVGAATTSSTSPKSRTPPWPQAGAQNGKWIKAHLGWVDAAVRLLRFLPTLPLFSHVWEAFLRRLQIEDGPHC